MNICISTKVPVYFFLSTVLHLSKQFLLTVEPVILEKLWKMFLAIIAFTKCNLEILL